MQVLDPDDQVRKSIAHLFEVFERTGSARAVVKHFREQVLNPRYFIAEFSTHLIHPTIAIDAWQGHPRPPTAPVRLSAQTRPLQHSDRGSQGAKCI